MWTSNNKHSHKMCTYSLCHRWSFGSEIVIALRIYKYNMKLSMSLNKDANRMLNFNLMNAKCVQKSMNTCSCCVLNVCVRLHEMNAVDWKHLRRYLSMFPHGDCWSLSAKCSVRCYRKRKTMRCHWITTELNCIDI